MAVSAAVAVITTGVAVAKVATTAYEFFSNHKEKHDNAPDNLLKSATKPKLQIDVKAESNKQAHSSVYRNTASPAA